MVANVSENPELNTELKSRSLIKRDKDTPKQEYLLASKYSARVSNLLQAHIRFVGLFRLLDLLVPPSSLTEGFLSGNKNSMSEYSGSSSKFPTTSNMAVGTNLFLIREGEVGTVGDDVMVHMTTKLSACRTAADP